MPNLKELPPDDLFQLKRQIVILSTMENHKWLVEVYRASA